MELQKQADTRKRFLLSHGQFFAHYRYKNLRWFLNGEEFGYGDLQDSNIEHIADTLTDGEEFVGYNEHHGTPIQQTKTPMLRIKCENVGNVRKIVIKHRIQIVAEEGV